MTRAWLLRWIGVIAAVALAGTTSPRAQDDPAVDHAKRVFGLLEREKFDDVAKEFNAQVAAAMSAAQLADVWKALHQQFGAFRAFIDQQVRKQGAVTAVVLGCTFEKSELNATVAFDGDDKIAGLRLTPRPAPHREPPAPPASSRFSEQSVTVGTGEWTLPGTLSMPAGKISGAVVLVHGSGPNDRDETVGANHPFRDLAWGLADRGIAVLRYEKRTRQYPDRTAAIKNLTVRDETIDDAIAAARLLRSRDRIDPKRVFVLGHSLGGTLAPRIAAEDGALAGIVIMAGATRPLEQVAREQIAYLASLAPAASPVDQEAALQRLLHAAPDSYWKDLNAYQPARTAATLTIPILILQGERDYQVTLDDLKGWRSALDDRPNVTIKTYPSLNHLFLPGEGKSTPGEYERAGRIPDLVLDDIARWIDRATS
jgi:hypothetical protein